MSVRDVVLRSDMPLLVKSALDASKVATVRLTLDREGEAGFDDEPELGPKRPHMVEVTSKSGAVVRWSAALGESFAISDGVVVRAVYHPGMHQADQVIQLVAASLEDGRPLWSVGLPEIEDPPQATSLGSTRIEMNAAIHGTVHIQDYRGRHTFLSARTGEIVDPWLAR